VARGEVHVQSAQRGLVPGDGARAELGELGHLPRRPAQVPEHRRQVTERPRADVLGRLDDLQAGRDEPVRDDVDRDRVGVPAERHAEGLVERDAVACVDLLGEEGATRLEHAAHLRGVDRAEPAEHRAELSVEEGQQHVAGPGRLGAAHVDAERLEATARREERRSGLGGGGALRQGAEAREEVAVAGADVEDGATRPLHDLPGAPGVVPLAGVDRAAVVDGGVVEASGEQRRGGRRRRRNGASPFDVVLERRVRRRGWGDRDVKHGGDCGAHSDERGNTDANSTGGVRAMGQPLPGQGTSPAAGPEIGAGPLRVVGLMSGTSHDAVDAAACDLRLDDDALMLTPLGHLSEPYPAALRDELVAALPPAPATAEALCRLDTGVGKAFAAVAARAVDELCGGRADLVVSHGQTLFHWVADGAARGTLQIGEPAWVAEATGLPVVSGLRTRDVAAGGQGAPLVGLFDALWLAGRAGTVVALNLGGIANVTVPRADGAPLAFDTGPACALLDAATRHVTGGRRAYDADGELAARGRVRPDLLARLLDEPYYARPAPKTTGKELFHLAYLLDRVGPVEIPAEDLLATLVALTG